MKVWAASSFIVRAIRVTGLHRITKGTVLNYLPIRVGQTFHPDQTAELIRGLFNTGFFEDVDIGRSGNTLIIHVVERATIDSISITGNHVIKKDDVKKVLKAAGIRVGNVYDHASIATVRQDLHRQYYDKGYYNARITIQAIHEARNRVAIKVIISEGVTAKIRQIKIIGNHAFSQRALLKQFRLTTPKLWTFITHSDLYSKPKLDASLAALKEYYLDHGYIKYKMDSVTVSLTPDRTAVYIVVKITEGPQYFFSGYKLTGNTIVPKSKLRSLINIRPGQVFSSKVVAQTEDAIGTALGDKGYAFARIEPVPKIDNVHRKVFITFFVNPGHKVYVRCIIFKGNSVTADYVLRNAVQQMEGGVVNVSKIRKSVRQLNILGYFKDVQVKTVPVPGTTNQVDIEYSLKEQASGTASINLGYGTLGFVVGAGVNQPNFLGTGRTVGLNISHSRWVDSANFNYLNPYFTTTGIGHGFSMYAQHTKPGDLNIAEYTFDTFGGSNYFTIPITLYDQIQVGLGYNNIALGVGGVQSKEISSFVAMNGKYFNQLIVSGGWSHNSLDQLILPTKGLEWDLTGQFSSPIFGEPLEYYKVGTAAHYYQPLTRSRQFLIELAGGVAYGATYNGQVLPFFVNYYAGGLSEGLVRGYATNTLGPKDSLGQSLGGNFLAHGTVAFIFPNYISQSVRTSVFVDMGNVYQTKTGAVSTGAGPLRYSAGLGVTWRSPFGPLNFSLAAPINKQTGDRDQIFQFTMGTSF